MLVILEECIPFVMYCSPASRLKHPLVARTLMTDSSGDLNLTIETSVDLREGAVWGQFDRAMAQLEGATGAGAAAAAGKALAAANDAAAEEAAHDSSDGEDDAGGAADALDAAPGTCEW